MTVVFDKARDQFVDRLNSVHFKNFGQFRYVSRYGMSDRKLSMTIAISHNIYLSKGANLTKQYCARNRTRESRPSFHTTAQQIPARDVNKSYSS